jgi:hypothetical protein
MTTRKGVHVGADAKWIIVHTWSSSSCNCCKSWKKSFRMNYRFKFRMSRERTFHNRDHKNINDQCDEQIDFHLMEFGAVHQICECNETSEPNYAMAAPFEKFAVRLEGSHLHEIHAEGHKLFRHLHIFL